MVSNFDRWMNRAWGMVMFGILPFNFAKKTKEPWRLFWIIFAVPWFVITLPVEFLLLIPAIFCAMVAITYMGE